MSYRHTARPERRPLDTPVRPASTGGGGGAPTGPAGGDLTGSYPNPTIGPGAVGNAEISDVAYSKVTGAPAIPTTLPPSGVAGGDLTGTYPNPTIGAGKVGPAKLDRFYIETSDVYTGGDLTGQIVAGTIAAGKVTAAKLSPAPVAGDVGKLVTIGAGPGLAYTAAPTALPPSGAAGGDLAGTYPNPDIKALAVGTPELAAGAVTDAKVTDVAWAKITGAPAALPPSGAASGDLTGTYPAPTIAKIAGAAVGTTTPLARGDVLTAQGTTPTLTRLPLGAGNFTLRSNGVDVIWATNAPGGGAGGDLGGNYPNPTVGRLNGAQLGLTTPLARGDVLVANSLPSLVRLGLGATGTVLQSNGTDAVWGTPPAAAPSGAAGGDLSGTYPNPQLAAGAIVDADVSATAAIQYTKLTGTPTALPPNGAASGDLTGTYPAPTLAKLNGATVGTTTPLARGDLLVANATPALVRLARGTVNQVLQSDGTDVLWGPAPATGGPPTGAASGSLAGSYPGPTIAASAVRGTPSAGGTAREIAKASIWAADDVIDLSIPTAKLAALAVTDAKINDLAATKLTGTIAQARLPVAPSGLLTANLNDAQVTDAKINDLAATKLTGTIAQARFPTAPSGLLTANVNDAQMTAVKLAAGAAVRQVKSVAIPTAFSVSYPNTADVVTLAITTSGGTVVAIGAATLYGQGPMNVLNRVSTGIQRDSAPLYAFSHTFGAGAAGASDYVPLPFTIAVDTPAAGAHVYHLVAAGETGSTTVWSAPAGTSSGTLWLIELS